MKISKLLPILLTSLLLILLPTVALAGAEVTEMTSNTEGITITITLTNENMFVSSYTCGIHYDTNKMTLLSVKGGNNSEKISIEQINSNTSWEALTYSTIAEAETNGNVGFAFVNNSEKEYRAGIIAEMMFRVDEPENNTILYYGDSVGANGAIWENEITLPVSPENITVTVGNSNYDETLDVVSYMVSLKNNTSLQKDGTLYVATYTKAGQMISVQSNNVQLSGNNTNHYKIEITGNFDTNTIIKIYLLSSEKMPITSANEFLYSYNSKTDKALKITINEVSVED